MPRLARGLNSALQAYTESMTIGASLFLIAVGAILRYAVTRDKIEAIDISTAGLILMLVGALGFLIALYFTFVRRDVAPVDRRYADEPPPRGY
jgi:preprotein translocase subunit Sss1